MDQVGTILCCNVSEPRPEENNIALCNPVLNVRVAEGMASLGWERSLDMFHTSGDLWPEAAAFGKGGLGQLNSRDNWIFRATVA